MKRFILILLPLFGINVNSTTIYSQEVFYLDCSSIKITLYVITPSNTFNTRVGYKEVKKIANIKITIKSDNKLENCDFLKLVQNLSDNDKAEIIHDFRIKCIIHKIFSNEVLYFNPLGGFLYNGHTYYNENIKKFVWHYLPQKYEYINQ